MKNYGLITKKDADTIYRAAKQNEITVLPETLNMVYGLVNEYDELKATINYQNDRLFYDRLHGVIGAIQSGNLEAAQDEISKLEVDLIERAGRKSSFYKYQPDLAARRAASAKVGQLVKIEGEYLIVQSAEYAAVNGTQWFEDSNWLYFDHNEKDESFVVKK